MLKKKLLIALLSFASIIILLSFIGYNYLQAQFQPVDETDQQIETVIIPKGSSTAAIGQILAEKNLIKNALVFQYYAKYTGQDVDLKAGTFDLSKSLPLKDVIDILAIGNNLIDSVRFTIPEGLNVKQIADRLAEQGLVDRERFLSLVKEGDFDYDFIQQIPDNPNIEYKLEGYLFPETYEVRKEASEEEIIDKMLSQFAKEWLPDWDKQLAKKGLSLHELITLASIVEREVVVDAERPIVAGIFYNRLENSWLLQSCATVQFVLGKQRDTITFADLEIDNPYNTYVYAGLPPGPIGAPGRISIEAVVNPDENNYFFFVTKKDNSGEHFFSKTYEEHLQYDAKSRGNW